MSHFLPLNFGIPEAEVRMRHAAFSLPPAPITIPAGSSFCHKLAAWHPSPTSAPHPHIPPPRWLTSDRRSINQVFPMEEWWCIQTVKHKREREGDAPKAWGDKNIFKIMLWEQHFPLFLSISIPLTTNAYDCKYRLFLLINILDYPYCPRENFISDVTRMELFIALY